MTPPSVNPQPAVAAPDTGQPALGQPVVSWRERIAYGVGGFPLNLGVSGLKNLSVPVYQMTLNVDPALLGMALALPRAWDAVTDPIMGHISDRTRSRFGRRRPYMVIGAALGAVAFALVWMVPVHWSHSAQLAWFIATTLLFYTCHTVWAVPYQSLGYEITPHYHERTEIMGVHSFFYNVCTLTNQWIFPAAQLAVFATAMQGVRWITGIVAFVVFFVLGLVPALWVRERFAVDANPAPSNRGPGMWQCCLAAVRNRGMRVLVVLTLLKIIAGIFASSLDYYLLVYYVFDGDIAQGAIWKGVLATGYAVIAFASIAPLAWLSRKFDKRRALAIVYWMVVIGGVAKWFVFRPGQPWLILIDPILCGALWVSVGMILPSMIADICDQDELEHGERREGLFGSLLAWVQKLAMSISFLAGGMTLNLVGFDSARGGDQEPGAMLAIRVVLVVATSGTALLALLALRFYPLGEAGAARIRAELEARRGVK